MSNHIYKTDMSDGSQSALTFSEFVALVRAAQEWSDGEFDGGTVGWFTDTDDELNVIIGADYYALSLDDQSMAQSVTQWPQINSDGQAIWACCVSRIGPVCGHRTPDAPDRA